MLRSLLIVAAFAAASPAAAFRAENGLTVEPVDNATFYIPWRGQSGARHFWCAAGDYVIRELGLPTSTDIYRYDAPVRQQGEGIRFGFDPNRATATGLLRVQGGKSLNAAYARTFCNERLFDR
ncbi:hypothetical protein PARPLA_02519 [Rhodobacteraceae bacterium THAF1]|uniref:hypothetical protein n=1 Tax=Palleronia sp. THAF1 TaxID=2587842 RepID=UPI000F3DB321|nr:hypothetical protein [Palleronia sp. THAF1]QFU07999.1 hypothetical protein FIU81_04870 [Palleronia sp. THAF1]VDC27850.1 hypothetical protein PARPLA_02519 [Rhodobacteraceae bacterium THAF1]